MLRPKSAGVSFLDDLLGNDPDLPDNLSGQRQRKSVRFFDQNDEESVVSRGRPHSSTLDSLLNTSRTTEVSGIRPHSSEASDLSSRSKSDWLGLVREESGPAQRNTAEMIATETPTTIANPQRTTTVPQVKITESSDWITAGLRARQPKSPGTEERPSFLQEGTNAGPSKALSTSGTEQRPWQPKVMESSTRQLPARQGTFAPTGGDSGIIGPTERVIKDDPAAEVNPSNSGIVPVEQSTGQEREQSKDTCRVRPGEDPVTMQQQELPPESQSAVYLQTKLRILSLEKTFLEETVQQMKSNHQQELSSMVSLYEQQMQMTSEMYKRHEEMIQEERDRRITELKSQLDHSEKAMQEMRLLHQQRLATVEQEWQSDVSRIRDSNSLSTAELLQQHQQEVLRLEKRLQNEDQVNMQTSTDLVKRHNQSVTELLVKWEQSAHKIEQLQRSVVARQEELVRQQAMDSEQVISRRHTDIELQWRAFVDELVEQRTQLEQVVESGQEKIRSEQTKMAEQEKLKADEERRELEALRSQFSEEVNQWRQRETEQAEKAHQERDKLRQDVLLYEERRSMLDTLYAQRKEAVEEEQTRLSQQVQQLRVKESQVEQQLAQLNEANLQLKLDQQQHLAQKELFDREKQQLAQMATSLATRAEELEKLSEVALKEKLDGIQAMDEMDSIQTEIHTKMSNMEESSAQLRKQQQRLQLERAQLEQQWAMLKELKESIVCNLCGTALSRANASTTANYSFAMFSQRSNSNLDSTAPANQTSPLFYSLLNGGYFRRQNLAANDVTTYWLSNETPAPKTGIELDQSLLMWQKSAQLDAASLAEETRFLDILKNKSIRFR